MNRTQATRAIKKGSHWTDGDTEVIIEKTTKRDVYYKIEGGGCGICEIWHFRTNFVPGRMAKKSAAAAADQSS